MRRSNLRARGRPFDFAQDGLRNLTCKVCPEPSRRVIPSTFTSFSIDSARNLGEIVQPVPSTAEGATPRNDTTCRIATHPTGAWQSHCGRARLFRFTRNDDSLSLFLGWGSRLPTWGDCDTVRARDGTI